ncbi:MAG: hypothetical protein KDK64_00500 [Chlamydiia bacterium]|nr:hypothetical protein [Chlamydiia bacterium]
MVDSVSSVSGAGFPSEGSGGGDVSLESELQGLSNTLQSPPGGSLSKDQLSGIFYFLRMIDNESPSCSSFDQAFTQFQQDYNTIMKSPGNTLSSDQLSQVSKDIANMAQTNPTMSEATLNRVMVAGLNAVSQELNSPNANVVDQAKGELIAVSSFLSGGPWGDTVASIGTQMTFDLNNNAPISAYENDIQEILSTPPFNGIT